jgi:nitroimidazol reductase NimA-like FMN-containing flavoprotein (pyridoxamine 5'-phosphate oxidase superfamily)
MSQDEVDSLIEEQFLCRIAFQGNSAPYIAPFQYAFMNCRMYFHFTEYGKKMSLLEEDTPVCVEVEKYAPDLSTYNFVVLTGKLQKVIDTEEKTAAIDKMVQTAKKKQLSTAFLLAHGLPKESGWTALTNDKSLIIVKLVEVKEILGLKSQ